MQQEANILSILQRRSLRPAHRIRKWPAHPPGKDRDRVWPQAAWIISLLFAVHILFPNLTPPPEKDTQTVRDKLHGPVMESSVLGMGDREIPGQLEDVGWELHTQENLMQNKTVSGSRSQKNYQEKERRGEMARFHCSGHLCDLVLHHHLSFLPPGSQPVCPVSTSPHSLATHNTQ